MYLSVVLLSLSSIIWGFGFVATRMTLSNFDPFWTHALRFIIAGLLGLPFLIYKKTFIKNKLLLKRGIIGASLLFGTLIFQTLGLNETTVAKSGFITTLYSFFVPISLMCIYRKKFRMIFWALVFMALIGMGLLCNLEIKNLNKGDLLTLICSLFASFHIIYIGSIANKLNSPIEFNFVQNFFMGLFGLILALIVTGPVSLAPLENIHTEAFKGILFLSTISSLVAFSVQVYAQQKIPSHIASLIYLLESPFAAWFGFIYYGEKLNSMNIIGAILILLSVCLVPILGREVTTS